MISPQSQADLQPNSGDTDTTVIHSLTGGSICRIFQAPAPKRRMTRERDEEEIK
jgi:hypothetical protein